MSKNTSIRQKSKKKNLKICVNNKNIVYKIPDKSIIFHLQILCSNIVKALSFYSSHVYCNQHIYQLSLCFQMYAIHLAQKAKELKREKRKSDSLLFQMLPPSVAMQLKHTHQVSLVLVFHATKFSTFYQNLLGSC